MEQSPLSSLASSPRFGLRQLRAIPVRKSQQSSALKAVSVPEQADSSGVVEDSAACLTKLADWLAGLGHDPLGIRLEIAADGSSRSGSPVTSVSAVTSGATVKYDASVESGANNAVKSGATVHRIGAVAGSKGVKQGEVTVAVPHAAMMNVQTAMECPVIGPVSRASKLTGWQTLLLHLLWERAKGEGSFWEAYVAVLPYEHEMAQSHPLMCSDDWLSYWLQGSPLLQTIQSRCDMCRSDAAALVAAGANNLPLPHTAPTQPLVSEQQQQHHLVSEQSVRWAASVLLSRAFALDLSLDPVKPFPGDDISTPGLTLCLVPWADCLNHSSAATVVSCLAYDPDSRTARLGAHRAYAPGSEVFDSYGPWLSPRQLFLDHGFVDEVVFEGLRPLNEDALSAAMGHELVDRMGFQGAKEEEEEWEEEEEGWEEEEHGRGEEDEYCWTGHTEHSDHVIELPASILGPFDDTLNTSLLEAAGLPIDSSHFSLTPAGPDDSIVAWLRAALASAAELAAAGWRHVDASDWLSGGRSWRLEQRAATVMGRIAGGGATGKDTERELYSRLASAARLQLQGYQTTIVEDIALLFQRPALDPGYSLQSSPAREADQRPIERAAVAALLSEKLALSGAIQLMASELQALETQG
ncbi:hypothetical protein CLOM_g653 [Closterium sp. NIES-68]|nr:hypothetical protein CLOM_g23256 [Closterium sp. NIES-68]GJP41003.1 hypothetical protein CLOM_g653 [Closterium sp. NIES-68]GJP62647.1 hypothetical protein CLOP_g19683 [Closterium sp. NIES-67]